MRSALTRPFGRPSIRNSRIVRAVRPVPLEPEWVERTVNDLERLVATGDETGLADRVVTLVAEQREATTA